MGRPRIRSITDSRGCVTTPTMTDSSNNKSLYGLTTDEQSVVSAMIAEHGPHLRRFLASRIAAPTDREDVIQEVYLRLARYKNLAEIENVRSFLFRIADNILKDRLRHAVYCKEDSHVSLEDTSVADASPDQEHIVQGSQTLAAFKRSLTSMRPKPRQAFLLSRVDEMPYRDIAKHMGVSVKSVEKYISDALAHIRKAIGGDGCRASLGREAKK